jgi:hypothetical protein
VVVLEPRVCVVVAIVVRVIVCARDISELEVEKIKTNYFFFLLMSVVEYDMK